MSALDAKSCQNQSKPAENTINFPEKRAPKARAKKIVQISQILVQNPPKSDFQNFGGGMGSGGGPLKRKKIKPRFQL